MAHNESNTPNTPTPNTPTPNIPTPNTTNPIRNIADCVVDVPLTPQACADSCYVINSCTTVDVPNTPCFPRAALVQIILAEPSIEVCLTSNIKLESPAIEIKRIRKDAFLREPQCKLVPTCQPLIYKLFVSGYVRANVEYAGVDKCTPSAVCGEIRHTTVHLPFSACTELEFPPEGPLPIFTRTLATNTEFSNLGQGPRLDKNLFTNAACYIHQPICTLICVNFQQYYLGDNVCRSECIENAFDVVSDYTSMTLRVRVLQLQPTPLNCTAPANLVYPQQEGFEME